MSLPGAWPAAPNGMPASITSGPGTSSWSPRLSRMARSVRHLPGIAALLAERGIDLAGRFTFHVLAAIDEMLADLISEGTKKAWPPPGPQPGRRPQAQALCPAG